MQKGKFYLALPRTPFCSKLVLSLRLLQRLFFTQFFSSFPSQGSEKNCCQKSRSEQVFLCSFFANVKMEKKSCTLFSLPAIFGNDRIIGGESVLFFSKVLFIWSTSFKNVPRKNIARGHFFESLQMSHLHRMKIFVCHIGADFVYWFLFGQCKLRITRSFTT